MIKSVFCSSFIDSSGFIEGSSLIEDSSLAESEAFRFSGLKNAFLDNVITLSKCQHHQPAANTSSIRYLFLNLDKD